MNRQLEENYYMKWVPNQWTIVRGEEEQLAVALVDSEGVPVNISGATQVSMRLYMADKTILVKPAYNGISWGIMCSLYMYGFQFSGAETLLMQKAVGQNVEIEIQFGTTFRLLEFPKSLSVIDRAVA